MQSMVLVAPGHDLVPMDLPTPEPGEHELLLRVRACGICRTDLHVIDGDLGEPKLPLVLGHEIVGEVAALGTSVKGLAIGELLGVPWLGHTCGQCNYCATDRENLCASPGFTGYQRDGGFAEYTIADPRYCFRIPAGFDAAHAAPLLCAGLIGYRALRIALKEGGVEQLGIYGFGAAAHIIAQVAVHQDISVHAFTRPGDEKAQDFARELGCTWAGDSTQQAPVALDGTILFAPVGELVPTALRAVRPGGIVVCAGIHMTDIPSFPYDILWGERVVRSVANLTRQDGLDFFAAAGQVPVTTHVETFPLRAANEAIARLRQGRVRGAAVLTM
ncbi:MAG: zinc-dependent alcohol dehydrogenase family protein [Planctomycetota bacterium]|jgi:propanol-preferring alcohol dehydrogenase